jgi:hypothetical protein
MDKIIDTQPLTFCPVNMHQKAQQATHNAIRMNTNPKTNICRMGFTLTEVMPLMAKSSILPKGYFVSPASRRSRS